MIRFVAGHGFSPAKDDLLSSTCHPTSFNFVIPSEELQSESRDLLFV